MWYIAVFSIRSHTMQFAKYMDRHGYKCQVISTPKRITSVCGVSVKFPDKALGFAKSYARTYSSFVGIYLLENGVISQNGTITRKI